MHAKNLRLRSVSATTALNNQFSSKHSFSNGSKTCNKSFFFAFIYALFGAIFSVVRQRTQKTYAAMRAVILRLTFFMLCFVIAFTPTILCFARAARNMVKHHSALDTICYYLLPRIKCHTPTATKQSGVFAVFSNNKYCLAVGTNFFVPNTGARNATH